MHKGFTWGGTWIEVSKFRLWSTKVFGALSLGVKDESLKAETGLVSLNGRFRIPKWTVKIEM